MCLGTFSRLRRSLATSTLSAAVRILAERFLLYRKAISCKEKKRPSPSVSFPFSCCLLFTFVSPLPKATAALFHIQFSLIQEQMTLPGSPAVPSTYDSGRPHISLRPDMLCVTQRICLLFVLYYPHRLPLQLSCQNLCINVRNLRFLWGM